MTNGMLHFHFDIKRWMLKKHFTRRHKSTVAVQKYFHQILKLLIWQEVSVLRNGQGDRKRQG